MTEIERQRLLLELQNPAYTGMTDQEVVTALYALNSQMVKERWVNVNTMMGEMPAYFRDVWRAIKTRAQVDEFVEVTMARLLGDRGINIADPVTIVQIDALVAAEVFTAPAGEAMKAMALVNVSLVEKLGLGNPTDCDVANARRGGN